MRNETRKAKKREQNELPENENDLQERMDMIGDSGSESDTSEIVDQEMQNQTNDNTNIQSLDRVEDLELQYKKVSKFEGLNKEMRELLPIKDKTGIIARTTEVEKKKPKVKQVESEIEEVIDNEEEMGNLDSDEDILESLDKIIKAPAPKKKNVVKLSTADLLVERQETIESLKFKIGVLCSGVLEKPEEKIKNLTILMHMVDETNNERRVNFFSIRKLAILSLMEIFKDIVPEYRVGIIDLESQQGTYLLHRFFPETFYFTFFYLFIY